MGLSLENTACVIKAKLPPSPFTILSPVSAGHHCIHSIYQSDRDSNHDDKLMGTLLEHVFHFHFYSLNEQLLLRKRVFPPASAGAKTTFANLGEASPPRNRTLKSFSPFISFLPLFLSASTTSARLQTPLTR